MCSSSHVFFKHKLSQSSQNPYFMGLTEDQPPPPPRRKCSVPSQEDRQGDPWRQHSGVFIVNDYLTPDTSDEQGPMSQDRLKPVRTHLQPLTEVPGLSCGPHCPLLFSGPSKFSPILLQSFQ